MAGAELLLSNEIARRVEIVRADHPPELVERLLRGTTEGDPAADSLAREFQQMPGGAGWEILDRVLRDGLGALGDEEASAELREVVSLGFDPPDWVDLDLVDAGALAYWRSGGINLGLTLLCGSLAYGYQSARLTRPLAATGRLTKMAPRRLQETSRWFGIATRPGALRPGASGVRATIKLRLVHALVRNHLIDSDAWRMEEWGIPISAADSLATALGGFMLVPVRAMRDLGVRFSPADLEAMAHQWTWIATLMGVPDYLRPASYGEAREMVDAALSLDGGPNEDSPKLMTALLRHGAAMPFEAQLRGPISGPALKLKASVIGGFTRRWMGDEMADRLGVPNTPLNHLGSVVRPLIVARELARASHAFGSDRRIAQLELALVDRLASARGGDVETLDPRRAAREPVLS